MTLNLKPGWLLLVCVLSLVSSVRAEDGWFYTGWNVDLKILPNSHLEVTETLDANFSEPKHGIVREIPVRYVVGSHLYDLRFRLLAVTDVNGTPVTVQVTNEENRVRLRLGDADKLVTGPQRYKIQYSVDRAILWEGGHAVLRWNAVGTENRVPIEQAVVNVVLPRPAAPGEITSNFWTGAYGSRNQDATRSEPDASTLQFKANRPLAIGEGITVDVGMPEAMVARSGWLAQVGDWMFDNFPYGLIPFTALTCFGLWWWRGRDAAGRGTIVVEYTPPDDLAPAEIGTLIDERVDMRDLSSTFIDLAVRGYVSIKEVKSGGIFGYGSSADYQFQKRKEPHGLKPFERTLFEQLFNEKDTVLLSSLKTRFYPAMDSARSQIYQSLSTQGYFQGNPDSVRNGFVGIGILQVLLAVGLCWWLENYWFHRTFLPPLIIAAVVGSLIVAGTSRVMPRRTRKGRVAWERIRGLEEYIRRAEIDDIKAQDRQGVFERLLPVAICLNLSDRWAHAFKGLYVQPPDWYETSDPDNFSMNHFVGSVNNSVGSMNTILPSQPRTESGGSSDWSSGGFGGDSSGGGSSGGGFGGGGSSSW